MSDKELIESAVNLKRHCYDQEGCKKCIFYNGNECTIYNFPEDWKINKEDKQ